MTGDRTLFSHLSKKKGKDVIFGDSSRGKVIGIGIIEVNNIKICDVLLVDGLKYNLLSISQLCDFGYHVKFLKNGCDVFDSLNERVLHASRIGDVYMIELSTMLVESSVCLQVMHDESWLWHRRLGHCSMELIRKLAPRSPYRARRCGAGP